jgi:hypothetical protein
VSSIPWGATLVAVVAVLTVPALSACGESNSSDAADAGDRESLGPINLADCTDWNGASEDARRRTIAEIRRFAGGPVPAAGGGGAVITSGQAYRLFENTCANDYARGFKLYKLYTRGAAFGGP